MKNLIILFLSILTLSVSAQKGYRYTVVPGTNNKYTVPYKEIKPITYAATKTLAPTQEETTYNFAQLTGAITISVTITPCYTSDRMICMFSADATNRIVTFSTGFSSRGTLTVLASGRASIEFIFNGTNWQEVSRTNYGLVGLPKTATSYTATGTVTVAELAGGILSVASGTLTLTLPTATEVATKLGAVQGSVYEFILENSSGTAGTATLAVGSGIVASGFPSSNTLTLASSATVGTAGFRLTFLSATAATLTRIN